MSNGLLRQVHRVTGLPPMARQVLTVLADEARDARGGRSSLTTGQIAERSGLSRRTIHRAYVILTTAGHITREETAPGAAYSTIVHPAIGARATPVTVAEGADRVAAPPCQPVRGSLEYIDLPVTNSPRASAREAGSIEEEAVAEAGTVDPVDQVFAAWDAWVGRAGLPGPVRRDAARRVAIDAKVREVGLGQVLMMIDTVERGVAAGGFRRKGAVPGQGDLFATFDAVFEVGHAAALRLFTRLLDGEFGRAVMPAAEPTERLKQARSVEPDEPAPTVAVRAALRVRLGERDSATWIDRLRFDWRADELLVVAPNGFVGDWVRSNYWPQIEAAAARAGGGPISVRGVVREKV